MLALAALRGSIDLKNARQARVATLVAQSAVALRASYRSAGIFPRPAWLCMTCLRTFRVRIRLEELLGECERAYLFDAAVALCSIPITGTSVPSYRYCSSKLFPSPVFSTHVFSPQFTRLKENRKHLRQHLKRISGSEPTQTFHQLCAAFVRESWWILTDSG